MRREFLIVLMWLPLPALAQFNFSDISKEVIRSDYRWRSFEEAPFQWNMKGSIQPPMNEGMNSLREGRPDRAVANFTTAIKMDCTLWVGYYFRGAANKLLNNLEDARKDFAKASTLNKKISEPYLEMGKVAFYQNDMKEAVRQLNQAIQLAPDKVISYYLLGDLYYRQNFPDRARSYYLKCDEIDKKFSDSKIKLGLLDIARTKDLEVGLPYFNEVLANDSVNVEALLLRSVVSVKSNSSQSRRDLTTLIEHHPANPSFRMLRGFLLVDLGKFDEAFVDLLKVSTESQLNEDKFMGKQTSLDKRIDLQYAGSYIARHLYSLKENDARKVKKAFCLLLAEKYPDCVTTLRESSVSDSSPLCVFLMGLASEHMGRHAEAEIYYGRALALDNDILDAHKKRGIYSTNKNDWKNGEMDFTEMLRISPNSSVAFKLRGVARFYQNDYNGAIDDFSNYLEKDSIDREALASRGICYAKIGETIRAADDLLHAGNLNAFNALDLVKMGQSFDKMLAEGDTTRVLWYLQRFTARDPYFVDGYVIKIKILRCQKNWSAIKDQVALGLIAYDQTGFGKDRHSYSYLLTINGMVLMRASELKKAALAFDQALEENDENSLAYLERGKLLLKLDREKDAKVDLTRAAKLGQKEAVQLLFKLDRKGEGRGR
jgi:tetratricopeptide (TPR) repeat protein